MSGPQETPPPTVPELFTDMCRAIIGATEHQELIWEHIDPPDGFNLVSALDETGDIEREIPR
jgi:hypothetical protein